MCFSISSMVRAFFIAGALMVIFSGALPWALFRDVHDLDFDVDSGAVLGRGENIEPGGLVAEKLGIEFAIFKFDVRQGAVDVRQNDRVKEIDQYVFVFFDPEDSFEDIIIEPVDRDHANLAVADDFNDIISEFRMEWNYHESFLFRWLFPRVRCQSSAGHIATGPPIGGVRF